MFYLVFIHFYHFLNYFHNYNSKICLFLDGYDYTATNGSNNGGGSRNIPLDENLKTVNL